MYYAVMPRCIEPELCSQRLRRIWNVMLLCLVSLMTASGRLGGQVETATNRVTTLRVFENLIQIPVVVLGPTFELMTPVAAKRFYISLDSGPPFQATHVRFQGDDSIALSIVVDLNSDSGDMVDELGKAIGQLGADRLRDGDRVSIYALRRCQVWRRVYDATPDLPLIAKQVAGLRQNWPGGADKKPDPKCQHLLPLLDALTQAITQGSGLPGRHVVLVLSDGEDRGSQHSWTQVRSLATDSGTAIFGLKYSSIEPDGFVAFDIARESPYRGLCESTGGLIFSATPFGLKRKLRGFMELLRKRYIVEFPRPDDAESGRHSMQVTISRSNAFIRSAGISVPIADPKMLADPNTLRSDPALAPKLGKRKPLGAAQ